MSRAVARNSSTRGGLLAAGLALGMWAAADRPAALCAQRPDPATGIEIVLDASRGMRGLLDDTEKMAVAKEFLDALRLGLSDGNDGPPMGLRVFGAGAGPAVGECMDTERLVRASDPPSIWAPALALVSPSVDAAGFSPLAFTLERAAADTATTYILITAGAGDCGGDACRVWQDLVRHGGNRRARLHVVAIAPEPADVEKLRCLSRAGSGSFTVLSDAAESRPAGEHVALILQNRGLLDVRLTVGGEEPFTAPVRVLKPLTQEVVAAFAARRPHEVEAGIYTVRVETSPPLSFERVLILPGETRLLERSDFGRLLVELADVGALRAPVSIRERGHPRVEVRYAATGETVVLRSGAYDVTVELEDSVAAQKDVRVEPGRTARVVFGGSGTLRVLAAGIEDPPHTPVLIYGAGPPDTMAIGQSVALPAGRYRLVVQTLPVYVTEDVRIDSGHETIAVVPETGVLGVDLYGPQGLIEEQRIDVREPLTGEFYGTLTSGERRLVMPATYRLELRTLPPRTIERVSIAPGERRIVVQRGLSRITLAESPGDPGRMRLELLGPAGSVIASAEGPRPELTLWPGRYRARVRRGSELLWEGEVSVASNESARIDFRAP